MLTDNDFFDSADSHSPFRLQVNQRVVPDVQCVRKLVLADTGIAFIQVPLEFVQLDGIKTEQTLTVADGQLRYANRLAY